MNGLEASLAIKTEWASRDVLEGGGKGTRKEALAISILIVGGSGPAMASSLATWDSWHASCLVAFSSAESLDGI